MTTHHHGTEPGTDPGTPTAGPFAVDPREPHQTASRTARTARTAQPGWIVWACGGAVATGAAIATAHGLYEVSTAARVPPAIAWLYPLITDGLALIAYAATTRLQGGGARYAWTVVVLAAGLSGLAQAAYLSAGPGGPGGSGGSGTLLRFGIGAWPAIAAAITAHLLYLLAAAARTRQPRPAGPTTPPVDMSPSTPRPVDDERPGLAAPGVHGAWPGVLARATDQPARARPPAEHTSVHARIPGPFPMAPAAPGPAPNTGARAAPDSRSTPLRERAAKAAAAHRAEHGTWPSVRALAAAADVSEGLAARTLRHLRAKPDRPTTTTDTTERPS